VASRHGTFTFNVEREIVSTIQKKLNELIAQEGLPFVVFNDYPMLPGTRRALSADIAILKDDKVVLFRPDREEVLGPGTQAPPQRQYGKVDESAVAKLNGIARDPSPVM
jgi:hypothetical protein